MIKNGRIIKYAAIVIGIVLLVLCIIPQTKYFIPSLFAKKTVIINVLDASGTAVADTTITVGSTQQTSDTNGVVTLQKVSVGKHKVHAANTFYEASTTSYTVPLFRKPQLVKIYLQPVGEITKVTIKNRISGRGVQNAKIVSAQGGSAVTNSEGVALLALPKGVQETSATVIGDDVLDTAITIRSGQSNDNVIYTTPKGRIAYLLNNNAKLQVRASNLDGTDAQVVLDGTGNEDMADTQLVGSPSYKFIALKSRRDASVGLYVVDVISSQITTLEDVGQSYIPIGWRGEVFVYMVYTKQAAWQSGSYKIKAYNALNQQTVTIDESRAEGASITDYASEVFENAYILPEGIVYAKKWQASYYYGSRLANKRMTLTLSDELGHKQTLQEWQAGYNASVKTRQTGPTKLSVFVELDGVDRSYYSYARNTIHSDNTVTEEVFKQIKQDTFFTSPNNLFSVWQSADSKNYVATVDQTASSQLQLPSSYKVIGWYTNDYIILQDMANNDLKITARDVAQKGGSTLKIGTVYVPTMSYKVYGYGR